MYICMYIHFQKPAVFSDSIRVAYVVGSGRRWWRWTGARWGRRPPCSTASGHTAHCSAPVVPGPQPAPAPGTSRILSHVTANKRFRQCVLPPSSWHRRHTRIFVYSWTGNCRRESHWAKWVHVAAPDESVALSCTERVSTSRVLPNSVLSWPMEILRNFPT